MRLRCSLVLASFLALALQPSNAQTTFDAAVQFSAFSNPSGTWTYGWEPSVGGTFTPNGSQRSNIYPGLDTWEGPDSCGVEFNFPFISFNRTDSTLNYASGVSLSPNMLSLHPSCSGKVGVLRWTAPAGGTFTVTGLFQGIDTRNTTTDVHIRLDSVESLLDANINGFGAQAPFVVTRTLAAGDTLDFVVGMGTDGGVSADSTGLAVSISTPSNIPSAIITVPGTAGPWDTALNASFDYGVHDNATPSVVSSIQGVALAAGDIITVRYLHGMVSGHDANGDLSNITNGKDGSNGRFPGFYINPSTPAYGGELVGTFSNNGVIVGQPFPIGNGPTTLTVPPGANQLQLGTNDNLFADNTGYYTVMVSPPVTTPPQIQCGATDGLWHASDVGIACTASDSGSGLQNPADTSFMLTTSVAAGSETANASTGSHVVCDNAGNCATAGPIAGNKIDKKAPSIQITTPANGATYLLNQQVPASYSCADGGSGIASCTGNVANGAAIPTGAVGVASFTVSASDNVGNQSSSSVGYTLAYNVCSLYNVVAKQTGSTYPIKLRLCDASGANVSSSNLSVTAVGAFQASNSAPAPLDDSGSANPDMNFRYDATLGGYIFNLSLNGYASGTYYLQFRAGNDPTVHSAQFQVK